LQVEHGSLYPALHRLEAKELLPARWESAGEGLSREYKYYRLTAKGKRHLALQESRWKEMAEAVARIMWPVKES
jgi:PadR family transcriptional regulator, regulatory protein PadR